MFTFDYNRSIVETHLMICYTACKRDCFKIIYTLRQHLPPNFARQKDNICTLKEDHGSATLTSSLLLRPKIKFHIWEMNVENNLILFLFMCDCSNEIVCIIQNWYIVCKHSGEIDSIASMYICYNNSICKHDILVSFNNDFIFYILIL